MSNSVAELRAIVAADEFQYIPKNTTVTVRIPDDSVRAAILGAPTSSSRESHERFMSARRNRMRGKFDNDPRFKLNTEESVFDHNQHGPYIGRTHISSAFAPTHDYVEGTELELPAHIRACLSTAKTGFNAHSMRLLHSMGIDPTTDFDTDTFTYDELRNSTGTGTGNHDRIRWWHVANDWFVPVSRGAYASYHYNTANELPTHLNWGAAAFPEARFKEVILAELLRSMFGIQQEYSIESVPAYLVRFSGHITFLDSYLLVRDGTFGVFYPRQGIGFELDLTTGDIAELGSPAPAPVEDTNAYSTTLRLPGTFYQNEATATYSSTEPLGVQIRRYAVERLVRRKASTALAWSEEGISCSDPELPFGLLAGTLNVQHNSKLPQGSDNFTWDVFAHNDNKSLVHSLRNQWGVGTVLRTNGLALQTTQASIKAENHTVMETVTKRVTIPPGRRRRHNWGNQDELHMLIYTTDNAEAFKTEVVEGQPDKADRAVGMGVDLGYWDLLMTLGRIVESYNNWHDGWKKAAKRWEEKHEDSGVKPCCESLRMEVRVETAA